MFRSGLAGIATLIAAAHAGAADAPEQKPRIHVEIKVVVTDDQAKAVMLKSARYVTNAGEAIPPLREGQHELGCTADVRGDPAGDFRKLQIPVRCIYRVGDKVVSAPTLTITDGQSGMMESGQASGVDSMAVLLRASLSEERLNETSKLPQYTSQSPVVRDLLSGL